MHWETKTGNRDSYKFNYTGKELYEPAKKKYKEFLRKERAARKECATFTKDITVSSSDQRLIDLKRQIEHYGINREQCAVLATEFGRNPEREYHLTISDVVYFDLINPLFIPIEDDDGEY